MMNPVEPMSGTPHPSGPEGVEVPLPTVWPVVLAFGIALLMAGVATNLALSAVGAVLFVFGLGGWIGQMLPGRGHTREPLVQPALRPRPVAAKPGTVDSLRPGVPGYRFQLPEKVHPISAGVKGGIVGGLVMPIPAFIHGYLSGHGYWFPINLLAGMVVPGISGASVAELEQFHPEALALGVVIHATFSVSFGLFFGVISPTLPSFPGAKVIAGGIVMPLVWSGICHGFMGVVDPLLERNVEWPWFVASQVVYGLAMSLVVVSTQKVPAPSVRSAIGSSSVDPAPVGGEVAQP